MPYINNRVVDDAGPMGEEQLAAIERAIGQPLPLGLRQHYSEHNGGGLQRRRWIAPDGDTFVLHGFLSMVPQPNRGFLLAWDVGRADPGFLPSHLIPFAEDEGGAQFCISDAPETYGQVFFFDPEFADDSQDAMLLAPSFHAFIEGMQE